MQLPDSTRWSVISLVTLASVFVLPLAYFNHEATSPKVIPEASAHTTEQNTVVTITTPAPRVSPQGTSEQGAIEDYIRTIFGSDARVAIAIQHNECNPLNKLYPRCRLTSQVEDSVGIFQINLKTPTTKVHFDRVPGNTLEEKVEWLKDPYNNTLMAYWIFKTSGFNPWTTYKNGSYLNNL